MAVDTTLDPLSDIDVSNEFSLMLGKFQVQTIERKMRQPFEDLSIFKDLVSDDSKTRETVNTTSSAITQRNHLADKTSTVTRKDSTMDLIERLKKPYIHEAIPISRTRATELSEHIGMKVDIHRERLASMKTKVQIEQEDPAVETEKAAVNIQRLFKGHIARKKYEKTKKTLEGEEELRKSDEASKKRQIKFEEKLSKKREMEEKIIRGEAEQLKKILVMEKPKKEEEEQKTITEIEVQQPEVQKPEVQKPEVEQQEVEQQEVEQQEPEKEAAMKIRCVFADKVARQKVEKIHEEQDTPKKKEEQVQQKQEMVETEEDEGKERKIESRKSSLLAKPLEKIGKLSWGEVSESEKSLKEVGKLDNFELKSSFRIKKALNSDGTLWNKARVLSKAVSAFRK